MKIKDITTRPKLPNYLFSWTPEGLIDADCGVDGSIGFHGRKHYDAHILNLMKNYGFNSVDGHFDVSACGLDSLKGSAIFVSGDFFCYQNKLTSLKGGPQEVSGLYDCEANPLTSVEHLAKCYSLIVSEECFDWKGYQSLLVAAKHKVSGPIYTTNPIVQQSLIKHRDSQDMLAYQEDLIDAGILT